jgi:transcriptional regulator with XRE-family HTH domain
MTTSLQPIGPNDESPNFFDEMFTDLPPVDSFEYKKADFAAQLAALLGHSGISRTELASSLDMKKSALTRLLSGSANPTLKTVWLVAERLGYDFDLAFFNDRAQAPKQPWDHAADLSKDVERIMNSTVEQFIIKTAREVAIDLMKGTFSDAYFCLNSQQNTFIEHNISHSPSVVNLVDASKDERKFEWKTIVHRLKTK